MQYTPSVIAQDRSSLHMQRGPKTSQQMPPRFRCTGPCVATSGVVQTTNMTYQTEKHLPACGCARALHITAPCAHTHEIWLDRE